MKPKMIVGVIALAAALAMSAGAASAQSPSPSADGRWTPYLGCWRLLPDSPRNQGMRGSVSVSYGHRQHSSDDGMRQAFVT